MRALIDAGIDEASVKVGDRMSWDSKDWSMTNDVVTEVQRNASGKIIGIGFGGWLAVFTPHMKLCVGIPSPDCPEPYADPMAQVVIWLNQMMVRKHKTHQEIYDTFVKS